MKPKYFLFFFLTFLIVHCSLLIVNCHGSLRCIGSAGNGISG